VIRRSDFEILACWFVIAAVCCFFWLGVVTVIEWVA
jgi:hypothetical protein